MALEREQERNRDFAARLATLETLLAAKTEDPSIGIKPLRDQRESCPKSSHQWTKKTLRPEISNLPSETSIPGPDTGAPSAIL